MSDPFVTAGSICDEQQPISRTDEVYVMPCSYAQQRLWFIDQWQPGTSAYNITAAVRLVGSLSPQALESSLDQVVSRHESLRTAFVLQDSEPFQRIVPDAAVQMQLVELSEHEPGPTQGEALALAQEFARRPLDLSVAPLLRALLIRTAAHEHLLVLVLHHIVTDGWSMGVLFGELSALYQARLEGRQAQLPPLPIQYADYALWQRERLQGQLLERELGYWRKRLEGLSTLELPTDRPRPPRPSYRGASQSVYIDARLSGALKRLARAQRCTLFMTLLAAFATLLQRYSGQADIAVGSPIAGRNHSQVEGLIGFFVNTLVLRTDASGNPSFLELLARVRENALEAYAHQELPFEKLVEALKPQRDPSRNPLTQVMFALQNVPGGQLNLPGVDCSRVTLSTGTAKFDLTLALSEHADGLRGELEYATDLFDAATIERLVGHWRVLLEGIVADPEQRISQLPLLTEAERHQLLVEWNDTAVEYPRDRCIHQLFEEQVERSPEATALVYEAQQLTYGELNARANRLAHHLRTLGVGPEVLVGVCLERSIELVVAMLAILKAGGAYVPLDPSYPAERLAFMLEDTRAPVLLTEQRSLAKLPIYTGHTVCLDRDAARIAQHPETSPPPSANPTNLAYVIYTSGSTGKPKGVMIEQRGLCNYLLWAQRRFPLASGDRVLQSTPTSFDIANLELFSPLIAGARMVIAEPGTHRFASELVTLARHQRITILQVVPSMLAAIVDVPDLTALKSLRRVFTAGELLLPEVVRRFLGQSDAELVNGYGPTETTIYSTFWVCDPRGARKVIPIGRPVANTRIYILDAQGGLLPAGIAGEVYIAGDGVARGYWQQPDLTNARFVPDPFGGPNARMYRTGDLARYLPDGNLEFLGRRDHQVKIRGHRIELGEVEAALARHPGIAAAVVTVRHDRPGHHQLVGYVIARGESSLAASEVRAFLELTLPDFMIPVAFVVLDEFPRTPSGKVDRKRLPAPDTQSFGVKAEFVAPRNAIEGQIAKIWADLLGLEDVGVHQDFFELGGHSLLAMRLVSRVRTLLGADVNVREFFDHPTVEGLARRLQSMLGNPEADSDSVRRTSSPAPQIRRNPRVPASRSSNKGSN